ncbi:MAG: ORF6N domain-containing protein [Sulfurimicrobium sp.]|nr:ORF6N domain-containing protein [Sulfurimicrobium sp.]MDP1896922.1 ORF6N domain-containing protein [Sulfurimicrobium sp.]MDP2199679.1 ORF6N domain-containing protein [Sulfurimicrobium sp.]MDP3685986.1 ORF6N domain-containing protein [Sulfurimicrobium sp.]MDZ7657194.1 ORF6N domain-containing protein [Sulfurimicrobium sp.]
MSEGSLSLWAEEDLVARRILLVRGQKVMLDADLAMLYGVETRALVQSLKRNMQRFPEDFMFQLTEEEWEVLRSQSVISKGRGGRRYAPYAFTEHGALMLASILNSQRAIEVGILVVRAFVRLRELLAGNKELAAKLDELERKLSTHDQAITGLIDTVRQLMSPPAREKRPIGFIVKPENDQ